MTFVLSETNPNDDIGGKGCLCSERESCDRKGPYAVFPHVDMEDPQSPHAVLCFGCAQQFVKGVAEQQAEQALLAIESTADEISSEDEDDVLSI